MEYYSQSMRRRLLLEASRGAQSALDRILSESQLTLGDWFEARIYEDAADLGVSTVTAPAFELQSLDELRSSSQVLSRLTKVDWAFESDDTSYLSHDLHPYAAKFIPQIPGTLISALTLRGELVWDPFGGSGTTALEAVIRSRRAISTDANPLAAVIGAAKTTTLAPEDLSAIGRLRDEITLLSRQPNPLASLDKVDRDRVKKVIPPIPNLEKWFHPNAVNELAILRFLISNLSNAVHKVALVAFSKIIVRASFQDSETRYAAKPRDIAPGATLRLFAAELAAATARVRQLGIGLQFRRPSFATVDLRGDVVNASSSVPVRPGSVSLIVTSPPYPNSMDYHLYHRFRLFWLGENPSDLGRMEIGSHLRHQRERNGLDVYLSEMKQGLGNCFRALQPGRYAAVVIGDCVYKGQLYKTVDHLADVAKQVGLETVGKIPRVVHATKRSFIPAARRTAAESILLLRKPPLPLPIQLKSPRYRLWPYEELLKRKEAERILGSTLAPTRSSALRTTIDSYEVDRLSRLTFTHEIEVDHFAPIRTWQAVLENGEASESGSRKDPKYVTHGIHPYKGKFYPQLAKSLFNLGGLSPGDRVLDPFCGSGTVVLEGKLNGLRAHGFDINPLAVEVTQAKCLILDQDHLLVDRLLAALIERLTSVAPPRGTDDFSRWPEKSLNELTSWFAEPVLRKLAWCLREIDTMHVGAVEQLLKVLLSSIVREVSQQDPQDLRIRRRHKALADAPVYELFKGRIEETRRRLRDFASRLDRCPYELRRCQATMTDSRRPAEIQQALGSAYGQFDAVVTSPPYATALPYVDTYRLNMLAVWGLSQAERQLVEAGTIGSREISVTARRAIEAELNEANRLEALASPTAQEIVSKLLRENRQGSVGFRRLNMAALIFRYFEEMIASLRNVDDCLKPGAQVFMVVGDNQTTTSVGPIRIATTQVLSEMAAALRWRAVDQIAITVTKENFKHTRNSITANTVLWFAR